MHLNPTLSSTTQTSSHPSLTASHFSVHPDHATRPIRFFHPTRAEFLKHEVSPGAPGAPIQGASRWSSRASRKNRYTSEPLHVHRRHDAEAISGEKPPSRAASLILIEQRLRHPHTRLKVHLTWDVSFWVAVTFVLGSAAWIVNGFILYLPISPTPVPTHGNAAAAIAFVGGTLFEVGSYLMYVESLNTGHEELFGEELLGFVESRSSIQRLEGKESPSSSDEEKKIQDAPSTRKFRWIGLGSFRELGFLASFVQLWAATIFWVSTITGLPGVITNLYTDPPTAITDVFYWTPQVIGGTGFIISSIFIMLEVQKRWWLPNLRSLGWHIGVWNLIGAVGFTMCGALGYAAVVSTKANYQSVMSTFWGSFAFMIGSCVQLWETLWREDPDADSSSSS
ncbi:hypothetical protein NM688_g5233 [Phlebia brevispora]|uniref:Uncharacterized protein n=1 Tax=Phlebia brevispora TaxID=194682 RepID=A0ACC1SYE7_9APHY|nr:hypothetical protein NM688_g5233 [Phlebia brevispora]